MHASFLKYGLFYFPFNLISFHFISFLPARKRGLRRQCFYTCLSVILFTGGCLPQCMLRHTPGADPPEQTLPLEQTPPPLGNRHPLEADTPSPGADTPLSRSKHPLPVCSACWEIWAASGRYASYWNAYFLFFTFFE